VWLAPDFLLWVEVLETFKSIKKLIHPSDVENIIPFIFAAAEEDFEGLFIVHQNVGDRISSAFFIT